MRNTLLLLGWIICVLGQIWARYSEQAQLMQSGPNIPKSGILGIGTPSQYAMGLLLYSQGVTTVAYVIRNEVESSYSADTVLSYLTLTA